MYWGKPLVLVDCWDIYQMPLQQVGISIALWYFLLTFVSSPAVLPLSSPFLALICVLFFCCTVATFVSHTVASLILMPIITSIGLSLDIAQPMVVGSAFASKKIFRFFISVMTRFAYSLCSDGITFFLLP